MGGLESRGVEHHAWRENIAHIFFFFLNQYSSYIFVFSFFFYIFVF